MMKLLISMSELVVCLDLMYIKTEDRQYDYVRDVYSTILIRDLVEKYKIRN